MMRAVWILLLCGCITSAMGQPLMLLQDSLVRQLRLARTDPERIDLHDQLGMLFIDQMENSKAVEHLHAGAELAREINDPKGIAYASLIEGLHHLDARRYREALTVFQLTIERLDDLKVVQGLLSPLGLIRQIYNEAGLQEERLDFYNAKLSHYRKYGPVGNLGACHHGIGGYYFISGHPDRAIENYLRAREIWAAFDPVGHANELWPIGNMYLQWGNLEKAEQYLHMAVEENLRGGLLSNIMVAYEGMATVELALGDTIAALRALNLGRPFWGRCPPALVAPSVAALVQIHLERGDLDSVGHYLEIIDSLDRQKHLYLYSAKGDVESDYYRSLYQRAQGDDAAADASLERALRLALEQRVTRFIQKYRKLLANRYQELGRTDEALALLADYTHVSDSLQQQIGQRKIAAYEMEARERESAAEHQRQEARLDQQRIVMVSFIAAAIMLALLVAVVVRNNRQKQRANKELDDARQRAEASEAFKQQFLANMSHEIRTPMNAIMGMSGILKRNEHTTEQDKYLNAISQSSENLLVILNDILDLSKLEAGKIDLENVVFDPRQVIGSVRDILRFKAEEKGLELEVKIADDVPASLLGDPTRLNQIVLNLAGNAVKFTEQGSVSIRVRWTADNELTIDVTDTGIGIPEDRLDRIFEEFTQAYSDTTRKYGGTGLGLTISKRLAELQGGSITVKSEKGKGSTFTVTIPYSIADRSAASATDNQQPATDNLRNLRILLAEDNDFNVMVAQDELADAIPGVQVDVAANGKIAVEMASANTYDVILMDVQMPEMNGYNATREIRALPDGKSRTPILAMTANVMMDEIDRCLAAGMNGHVPKPFKREELLGALHLAIGDPRRE